MGPQDVPESVTIAFPQEQTRTDFQTDFTLNKNE